MTDNLREAIRAALAPVIVSGGSAPIDAVLDAIRDFARTHPLEAAQALGLERLSAPPPECDWCDDLATMAVAIVMGGSSDAEPAEAFYCDECITNSYTPPGAREQSRPLPFVFAAPQGKTEGES